MQGNVKCHKELFDMSALVIGFRETLEAAVILALLVALVSMVISAVGLG